MKTWKWMCVALACATGQALAAEPATSELSCSDFKPTPEAAARFAALKGACDGIVQMKGTTYARFKAIVRSVSASEGSVTLNLPTTDSTFTVTPPTDARVLVEGKKTRVRDLHRGQEIQFYLSTDEFATPNIQEVQLVKEDSSEVVPVVVGAMAGTPVRVTTNTVKAQAIVEAIDPKTREIKLLGADNRRFTIVADASIRNFDQIHPRDRVNVEYLQSVAIAVFAMGAPAPATAETMVDVAAKGDKPAYRAVDVVQIEATVTSLDREARRATLLFSDGSSDEVTVRPDTRLDLVNVGDRVRMTLTKAVAISVTPPPS